MSKEKMPNYMEGTILDLPKIYINGGRRGFLVMLRFRRPALPRR
jgi:prolyl-tRNA editing enzyme YbaK/EbsC (Cys-tRNA(Pro) deacylase)